MQEAGVQFHEEIPEIDNLKSRVPQGILLVLDDLMTEGGQDKEHMVNRIRNASAVTAEIRQRQQGTVRRVFERLLCQK